MSDTAAVYFLPAKTTVNGRRYPNLLHDKWKLPMNDPKHSHFMHEVAPCHTSMDVKDYMKTEENPNVWPG